MIVTVPALIPFTVPVLLFTVAIFVLLLLYVTEDTPASVAFTVAVFPVYTTAELFANFTDGAFTVTLQVVLRPVLVVAVIVTVPAFIPFTTPVLLTVAIALLLVV